jgi:hypothetical protein
MYSPVLLTILARRFLGAWMETDNFRHCNPSCVGINVDSADYSMRKEHQACNNRRKAMAIDYKYFDSRSNDQVREALKRRVRAYTGDDEWVKVRDFLIDNCMQCFLVLGDYLLYKEVGGSTGNPMTVNWNNHMSEFYARAAYQGIAAANCHYDVMPAAVYHHHVGQLVYGDDNDFALTVPVSEWFNFFSMRDFLDQYNIWITTSSKDASDEAATVDFLDSDFLCRRPRLDHTGEYGVKFVAYPYKEVYDSLNWQSDHVDDKFALYQNAVGILYRSVGLGREEFYKEFDKLEKALADVGVRAPLPRWQDVKPTSRIP